MKTKFIGPIRDNLVKGKVLLFGGDDSNPTDFQGIRRSAEGISFVGNEFRIPLKTRRNPSVGFRSENETLPAPGAGGYTYMSEPMRYAYALFNITGQLMKAAEVGEGAFASAFQTEMEDTVLASKLDHNRAAYGDGVGILAVVRTTQGGASATVDVVSTINFRGGEIVDLVNIATGVVEVGGAAFTVLSVDRTNRTITLDRATDAGGLATATTEGFVRASSDSTASIPNNSWNKEIQGLASIVNSTGTLHGVSPTTYPFWKSYVDSAAAAISDTKLRTAVDETGFESGADDFGTSDFVLVTTRGVRRRYADTLVGVKRFTNEQSTTLRGGFKVLLFDEQPIFVDDQCPVGHVYGLSLSDLFWAEMSDWDWMDEDGKVLKWESRKDRYIAVLYKYTQLGTTARNRHFKLTAVTDDVK